MSRLLATLRLDSRLQFRYGFYYAGIFVAVLWLALLMNFSKDNMALLLPVFLLGNLAITTFYFMAGLVLLEKGEGTLEGLITTPLRTHEYLASKVATLTFLATAESLLIVLLAYGIQFRVVPILAGLITMSAILTLFGFIVIARYDSVTDFLLPSAFYTIWISLPVLDYFEIWPHWILYLVPSQAALLLMKAAFAPVEDWQLIYAVAYSVLWTALFYVWAQRRFLRFVIRREGVS